MLNPLTIMFGERELKRGGLEIHDDITIPWIKGDN